MRQFSEGRLQNWHSHDLDLQLFPLLTFLASTFQRKQAFWSSQKRVQSRCVHVLGRDPKVRRCERHGAWGLYHLHVYEMLPHR